MQTLGIIDGGGDALGFQPFRDLVPFRHTDGILGVHVGIAGADSGVPQTSLSSSE